MTAFERVQGELRAKPRRWAVTGAAGFIGSHLVEALLELDQTVRGLDDFSTGSRANLEDVRARVEERRWRRFSFVEGDLRDPRSCAQVCEGADVLLQQAALGSVPRSIADPVTSTSVNVEGFVQALLAARDAGARVVYASSSSVYGDHPGLPKVEETTGAPLSPYAATKCANELYASVFSRVYSIEIIGLRYFNVFGPRQDPRGAYAAVIPRWIQTLIEGGECTIFGDGATSRDFSYVSNVVQANLLAGVCSDADALGEVMNVAVGGAVTLEELYRMIWSGLRERLPDPERLLGRERPAHADFRPGDVRHSSADVGKARRLLGFEVACSVEAGLAKTLDWYLARSPA